MPLRMRGKRLSPGAWLGDRSHGRHVQGRGSSRFRLRRGPLSGEESGLYGCLPAPPNGQSCEQTYTKACVLQTYQCGEQLGGSAITCGPLRGDSGACCYAITGICRVTVGRALRRKRGGSTCYGGRRSQLGACSSTRHRGARSRDARRARGRMVTRGAHRARRCEEPPYLGARSSNRSTSMPRLRPASRARTSRRNTTSMIGSRRMPVTRGRVRKLYRNTARVPPDGSL